VDAVNNYKPARRKTWAFFYAMTICAISAFRFKMDWPLACLIGFLFMLFVGAVSTEKILLAWINRGGKHESN
jgi:membrane protein required for beta-lactamase induction